MFRKKIAWVAILVGIGTASFSLSAQQPSGTTQKPAGRSSADAVAERITNIDALRTQLKQYEACTCKCGCYAHDLDRQADSAIAFLQKRAAHKQEKLALVLDIDETSLNNYEQDLRMNFGFEKKGFDDWVESAKAPVIPGTLRLYKEAQKLGVSVFFITGRAEAQREATEKNLHMAGYENWQGLTLRSAAQARLTAIEYKSAERAKIVAQGYKIILNVGDQWSDLYGKPEAEFSVKYPNPFYFIP